MWYDRPRKDGTPRMAGHGIIDKVKDFDDLRKKWIGWAELIWVVDNVIYLDMMEPYRKMGYPIFGCNIEGAKLELDREAGQKMFRESGLKTIDSKTFHDYGAGAAYVKKMGIPMVSKPSGDANKALSYVAPDAASMVYMMEDRWAKNPDYVKAAKKDGFIVQERKYGCEMAVGGWFGPGGWAEYWCENFEFKKFMDGDLGVNTGEAGTLVRYTKKSKLADKVLKPLEKSLSSIDYVGYVDINCIITPDGTPWPMEATMRHGWPISHNQTALHQGDPAQWMLDLLNGYDTLEVSTNLCVSVVVTIPDFPYSKLSNKEVCGIPLYNACDMEHIHLSEVMIGKDVPVQCGDKVVRMPCYVTSGDYVMVVTGMGKTISGARKSAYTAIDKIKIPNDPQYRLGIGKGKLVKTLPEIQAMGYAKGITF